MHTLSVIIPTLNEATNIVILLHYLRNMEGVGQVIVADGGSEDATVEIAREHGALVVQARRNRGAQLNAGAAVATGSILWFLHADAQPHPQSALYIMRAVRRPHIIGGNFRLRFNSDNYMSRCFEAISRVQRRWQVYYGDSGIFVRREVFDALNGYQEWPLFEDYDFVRILERYARQQGQRTIYSRLPATVSARRFQQRPGRTLLLWLGLQVLFSLGVSPHRLARLYHKQ